jgi:hypothetical protein
MVSFIRGYEPKECSCTLSLGFLVVQKCSEQSCIHIYLEEQKGKLGNHNNKGLRAFWLVCP